jgi:nitroreductase/dihydropteridine reductase
MARFFDSCPDILAWCKHQAYIALGFALAAAAEKKITTCPMEGFIPSKVAELLGLDDNLVPSVLLAVGREGDNSKLLPRFRFNRDELITEV